MERLAFIALTVQKINYFLQTGGRNLRDVDLIKKKMKEMNISPDELAAERPFPKTIGKQDLKNYLDTRNVS